MMCQPDGESKVRFEIVLTFFWSQLLVDDRGVILPDAQQTVAKISQIERAPG